MNILLVVTIVSSAVSIIGFLHAIVTDSFSQERRVRFVSIGALLASIILVVVLLFGPNFVTLLNHVSNNTQGVGASGGVFASGTLVLNDSLQQEAPYWEKSYNSTDTGRCEFINGSYFAIQPQPGLFTTCVYGARSFNNFSFEIDMTILSGDCGGVLFDDDRAGDFYYFRICQPQGTYVLDVSEGNKFVRTLQNGHDTAFRRNLNQFNVIGLIVHQGDVSVFVNDQPVLNNKISTFEGGFIGVIADNLGEAAGQTEVAFNYAKVWV